MYRRSSGFANSKRGISSSRNRNQAATANLQPTNSVRAARLVKMALVTLNLNADIDAIALYDKVRHKLGGVITTGGTVVNALRKVFLKDRLALLKRGLEGTGYNVDMPQLRGPTITTVATLTSCNSPFADALQRNFCADNPKQRLGIAEWCRMTAFNADPKVVLGVRNPTESEQIAQSAVLNALEYRGFNSNSAWQIYAAGLVGAASAIDQNLRRSGLAIIEFDLVKELRASANGETGLGRLTKYKGRNFDALILRLSERLRRTGQIVNGRVQVNLKQLCLQMRSASVDPNGYLRIRSKWERTKSLPSEGPWYQFAASVAATNMILQDLYETDTGDHKSLLSSIFPEESCLPLGETGRASDLANNTHGRMEYGVNHYIVKSVLLVYTIYRQASLQCDVNKLPFDDFDNVHRYTRREDRLHGGSEVNASGLRKTRLIDYPAEHLSATPCTIYDYECDGDVDLFADMKAIFGKTNESKVTEFKADNIDVIETFLFNLLQYDQVDEGLQDRITGKAKVLKPVFAVSDDYIVILMKQSKTLILIANESIGSESLEWFGRDSIVQRTPSDTGLKIVPEVMTALNCSVRRGPKADVCASMVSKLFSREHVSSLGGLVSRAEKMIINEARDNLLSWQELSGRVRKIAKPIGVEGAAKGQRYLAHMLTAAGVKCYRAPRETGACYFEALLGIKLEELNGSNAEDGQLYQAKGLLIDFGVSLQGVWTFSSPYVKGSIMMKWDKVRYHNYEFMISADNFDSVEDISRSRVGRVQVGWLTPAGNNDGEEHWTIRRPIKHEFSVEGRARGPTES